MTADPAALANLRDIALPTPIAWWPPQPGWWLVTAALLALVGFGVAALTRCHHANAYRRAALRELPQTEPQALGALLKRTALAAAPRAAVASLTGDAWATFLQQTGGFPRSARIALAEAALQPSRSADAARMDAARAAMRHWIRHHRVRT
jgi:hypothetical protein